MKVLFTESQIPVTLVGFLRQAGDGSVANVI